MNLDLDDPLGDLLSDGSNDSLFGFETTTKKSLPAKTAEKKDEKSSETKMEQLFGIEDRKSDAIKPKTAELKLFSNELNSPVKTLPLRPATAAAAASEHSKFHQTKTSTDDFKNLDVKSNDSLSSDVGVVGLEPKKSKRKMSILDELLGIGEPSSTKNQYQSSSAKQVTRENNPQAKATSISRQTTFETVSDNINSDITTSAAAASTKKTGRRQSAVAFSDPLGLFGPNEKEKDQIKKAQTKQTRKSIAGSEWLFNGGNNDTQNATDARPVVSKTKSSPAIHITANSDDRHEDDATIQSQSNITSLESKNTGASSNIITATPARLPLETLVNQSVDAQNTSLNSLKQQEFQLMVATQMKTQENVLVEMKNKQQDLLRQQEGQFNDLLRKQISRQSELEEIIRHQQVRVEGALRDAVVPI